MNNKTDFYNKYPNLIEDESTSILNDESVLSFLEAIYETMVITIANKVLATNKVKDQVRCRNIAICIIDECIKDNTLNCKEKTSGVTRSLYQYFHGDIENSVTILRDWMVSSLNVGAYKASMSALSELAAKGEKFKNANFQEKRKVTTEQKHAEILKLYNKLTAEGLDKSTVHQRIKSKFDISSRQIQRIIKKSKNDIKA